MSILIDGAKTEISDEDFRIAELRIRWFVALKGWGHVREDGNWASWQGPEITERIDEFYLPWSLSDLKLPVLPAKPDGGEAA